MNASIAANAVRMNRPRTLHSGFDHGIERRQAICLVLVDLTDQDQPCPPPSAPRIVLMSTRACSQTSVRVAAGNTACTKRGVAALASRVSAVAFSAISRGDVCAGLLDIVGSLSRSC